MTEIIEKSQQLGMPAAVFFAAVTIGLWYAIGWVASKYGPEVKDRFLERDTNYDAANMGEF